jgi:hypothetical protein
MVALRPLLYAAIIFVALGVISLLVAVIMKIMYDIVHRKEKKPVVGNKVETKVVPQ